uniref:ELKS/RAB6-interacting/CAST family member 1 n=1 Tax=Esox lucius TaxID=8010 RepID=A0A3P8ZWI9_ESOLU
MYGGARSVSKMEGNNGGSQSPGRSPRLPRSPRLGHRRTNSTGGCGPLGGPGAKTLSMENIQSMNAAYATSGPMYLSDNEVISHLPKSTMTLGRSGGRLPYGVRATATGSSPNVCQGSSPAPSDSIAFGGDSMSSSQTGLQQAATVPHSLRQARDNTIMDLQAQLKEVLRENELLRREADVKESKLSSSMNSIKTFWSPELKKERALRKDEVSKILVWKEQYRVLQEETQHLQMTVQALQDELRIQRDLNQLFQQDCGGGRPGEPLSYEPTEENFHRLHAEHERQAKELFLLRKTLEEMELRIDTQKQTLGARDESIKKLLEMLQSKGLSAKATEEDHERTRRLAEAEMHIHHLDGLLEQKDKETSSLREELHRRSYEGAPESAKTKALQTVIEMKDSKIQSLERGLRDLEEEIQMLKSNGALSTEEREEEMKQMEVYRSHSKFMKNKVDQVKQDLGRKDTELMGLRTKLDTLTNQFSDSKQHIEVLKESLTAKEQRSAILQTEIENLQEQLRDKETQMSSLKDRVKSLQTDTSNTDTALSTLEESLAEKERIIERLKEQRDRDDREKTEEMDSHKRELKVLREKLTLLQGDLSERETSLLDLKEHASSLASSGLKKDSKLKSLEIALEQKKEECVKMENQLKKAQANTELSERIATLEQEVTRHREDSGRAQAEVDRLLEILREMENEKNDKDKKINELEKQMKDQTKKVASLKHKEQVEKSKNAQLMEEVRKREDNLNESSQQMEELLAAMEKVKQELDSMQARLTSTQQSLAEKEAHLTTLRAERRRHLEEVLEMKQEALLAAISEKDANIALLELSSSKKKKTQDEVAMLKREKDRLVQQLKQQTQNRMKLMADNYEDEHLKASSQSDQTNHKPSPDQANLGCWPSRQSCKKKGISQTGQ